MNLRRSVCTRRAIPAALMLLFLCGATPARAQGPAPETAPTLFPGGGLISYNSIFTTRGLMPGLSGNISETARPTFSHEGDINFTWGFYRNFDLTIVVPVVTNHFEMAHVLTVGGTGLGDAMVLVKYRFYRRDSSRGTTGFRDVRSENSNRPDALDRWKWNFAARESSARLRFHRFFPGRELDVHRYFQCQASGSGRGFPRDPAHTGNAGHSAGKRSQSRFWLSYRPYESKDAAREWFVGPALTWLHSQDDRIVGVTQAQSGGDALLVGATTYVGVRPGMHLWLGMDWDAAHSTGALFMPVRRHISFGITQQFRLHF